MDHVQRKELKNEILIKMNSLRCLLVNAAKNCPGKIGRWIGKAFKQNARYIRRRLKTHPPWSSLWVNSFSLYFFPNPTFLMNSPVLAFSVCKNFASSSR
jgi:hypothetical protein